jgi:hypothetical protein
LGGLAAARALPWEVLLRISYTYVTQRIQQLGDQHRQFGMVTQMIERAFQGLNNGWTHLRRVFL